MYFWSTVLEVMQFARDAHMAEGWMIAQEPYLKNENLGVSRLDLRFTKMSDDLKEIVRRQAVKKTFSFLHGTLVLLLAFLWYARD